MNKTNTTKLIRVKSKSNICVIRDSSVKENGSHPLTVYFLLHQFVEVASKYFHCRDLNESEHEVYSIDGKGKTHFFHLLMITLMLSVYFHTVDVLPHLHECHSV